VTPTCSLASVGLGTLTPFSCAVERDTQIDHTRDMSGVGEALAITGCVFGLIQAYDAASRSIERIQERRRAHRALPPTERLRDAVEQGKNEIQAMVAHGNERFGPEFEKGDSMYWSRF
jgi:hypothetical protein